MVDTLVKFYTPSPYKNVITSGARLYRSESIVESAMRGKKISASFFRSRKKGRKERKKRKTRNKLDDLSTAFIFRRRLRPIPYPRILILLPSPSSFKTALSIPFLAKGIKGAACISASAYRGFRPPPPPITVPIPIKYGKLRFFSKLTQPSPP